MDILDKNIYETLISSADDETVIQMLNANVNFRPDDSFFERLMSRKYPLLMKFKSGTWKQTYLKMVHYIAKLEEEFGIPYILSEDFNPEKFYKEWSPYTRIYDIALVLAVEVGDMTTVQKLADKALYLDWVMIRAAFCGHIDIVKFLFDKGANDFDSGLMGAAEAGHIDIVQLMLDKGAQYYNSAFIEAARHKQRDVVQLLLDKGVNTAEAIQRARMFYPPELIVLFEDYLLNF